MLTVLIGFVAFVVLYCCIGNGQWGAAGVTVAIVVFLWICASSERIERRAWRNRVWYWAEGGPDNPRRARYSQSEPARNVVTVNVENRIGTPDVVYWPVPERVQERVTPDAVVTTSVRTVYPGYQAYQAQPAADWVAPGRFINVPSGVNRTERLFVCPVCGRSTRAQGVKVERDGRIETEYWCKWCRATRSTGI